MGGAAVKHRDWVGWTVFIIAGAVTYITAHYDKFPWIPQQFQGLVEMLGVLATGVGAKLSTSGLTLSPEGRAQEAMDKPLDTPELPQPPVLPPAAILLLILLIPAPASAQVIKGWDWFSWGTAAASVAVDTVATFHCPERLRCIGDQATRELGTFAIITVLKNHIHSERPCAPDCGFDNPFENMPSAHGGWGGDFSQGRCSQKHLAVEVPLGALTAIGRVKARKHTILATVVGAGVGVGVSALSSAVWCR